MVFASCKSLHEVQQLPKAQYHISSKDINKIDPSQKRESKLKIFVESNDSAVILYVDSYKKTVSINSFADNDLVLRQRLIDVDIFTISFKIRSSVNDFPPQLNPNFSAAIYLGRRHNY